MKTQSTALLPQKEKLDLLFDATIFKLLSESVRMEILKILTLEGPSDITAIAEHFSLDRSVISKHLKILHEGGLLIKTKESRSTIYQVDGLAFLQKMESVVSDVKEMLAYCCGDTFQSLYEQGITYGDHLNQTK